MPPQTLLAGQEASSFAFGDSGATVANAGPSTVYYNDQPGVSSSFNDGSIASGASVTLYGQQWLYVDRAGNGGVRADLEITPLALVDSSSKTISTVGMNGTVDIAPQVLAALDAGYRHVHLYGGGRALFDSGIFLDDTTRDAEYKFSTDGRTTIVPGPNLPRASTYETVYPGVGFIFHNNAKRAALSGGVVTYNDAQMAVAQAKPPRVVFENFSIDSGQTAFLASTTSSSTTISSIPAGSTISAGMLISGTGVPDGTLVVSVNTGAGTAVISQAATATATGVSLICGYNAGLVHSNTASVQIRNFKARGIAHLAAWRGYSDQNYVGYGDVTGMNPGGWLVYQESNGDAVEIEHLEGYRGGIYHGYASYGARIAACDLGTFSFTSCQAVRMENIHTERTGITGAVIKLDRSEVTVADSWHMLEKDLAKPTFEINDDPSDSISSSTLTLISNRAVHYFAPSDVDAPRAPLIKITAANIGTRVKVIDTDGSLRRSAFAENHTDGIGIVSDDTAIQAAITAGRAIISSGSAWELRYRGSSVWEVVDLGQMAGFHAENVLSDPSWGTNPAATSSASGGTLLAATTYAYAAATVDGDGNYSLATSEQTTTTSTGVVGMQINTKAPAVLRVWRKVGTGVLSAPDAYADLPVNRVKVKLYDTGVYVNGVAWITTSVPVPNTVAAANNSWSRIKNLASGVALGSGAVDPGGKYAAVVGSEYRRTDTGRVHNKLKGTDNGGWYPQSGRIAADTTGTTIVNTTTESDVFRLTVPGGITQAGDLYIVEAFGDFLNNSGGTVTLTHKFYVGTTAVFTATAAFSAGTNANRRPWVARFALLVHAVAGTKTITGEWRPGSTAGGTWPDAVGPTSGIVLGSRQAASAEDMASDKALAYTMTLNTASASAEFKSFGAVLYRNAA